MDKITEFGELLTKICMSYYDMVNDTDNLNIIVGMSADVSTNDKRYRYTVKIEKEEL